MNEYKRNNNLYIVIASPKGVAISMHMGLPFGRELKAERLRFPRNDLSISAFVLDD